MPVERPAAALYPEIRAGRFSRVDGTIEFYVRVHALLLDLQPGPVVLDFGAGRGAFVEDPVPIRRDLRRLQGRAGRVVGVDIEQAVMRNPTLDEAHVVRGDDPLPLADGSVDLVIADFAFEHVTNPALVASELDRVLRPAGWVCARTPNRWGYIGLGARLVPRRMRAGALRRLNSERRSEDSFPTVYRMNTGEALKRWFPPHRYEHVVYAADSEPAYVAGSKTAARLIRAACALTPPPLRSVLYVFLHKRGAEAAPRTPG